MSTTTIIKPSKPAAVDELPTAGEMLAEIVPLVGIVLVAGPPVVLLAGPLVLGTLMLAGPFALAVTGVLAAVAALVAAGALVALTVAIVATPHRLVRHVRARHERHARIGAPAGRLVTVEPRHRAA